MSNEVELEVKNFSFRDPAIKDQESWRVMYNGKICLPDFNSKGAADAYIDLLNSGKRKPEYENETQSK